MTARFDELLMSDVSSLSDFPLVGRLIGLLDGTLADLGMARWFRESVELLLLTIVLYQVVKVLFRRFTPWLADLLRLVTEWMVEVLCALLLLPDLALTKLVHLMGFRPPDLQYACGHAVLDLEVKAKALVRLTLPKLAVVRALPGLAIFALVCLSLFWWNSVDCVSTVADTCSTPVERWLLSTGL